jgi:hypothetical protein
MPAGGCCRTRFDCQATTSAAAAHRTPGRGGGLGGRAGTEHAVAGDAALAAQFTAAGVRVATIQPEAEKGQPNASGQAVGAADLLLPPNDSCGR